MVWQAGDLGEDRRQGADPPGTHPEAVQSRVTDPPVEREDAGQAGVFDQFEAFGDSRQLESLRGRLERVVDDGTGRRDVVVVP